MSSHTGAAAGKRPSASKRDSGTGLGISGAAYPNDKSPKSSHESFEDPESRAQRLREIKDLIKKEGGVQDVPHPADTSYGQDSKPNNSSFVQGGKKDKDKDKDEGYPVWIRVDGREFKALMKGADGFKLNDNGLSLEVHEKDKVAVFPFLGSSFNGHTTISGSVLKGNDDEPYCSFVVQSNSGNRYPVNFATNCIYFGEDGNEIARGRISLRGAGKRYRGFIVEGYGSPSSVLVTRIPASIQTASRHDTLNVHNPRTGKTVSYTAPQAELLQLGDTNVQVFTFSGGNLLFLLPGLVSVSADSLLNGADCIIVREDGKEEEGVLGVEGDSLLITLNKGKTCRMEIEPEGSPVPTLNFMDQITYQIKDVVYRRKVDSATDLKEKRGTVSAKSSKGGEPREVRNSETRNTEVRVGTSANKGAPSAGPRGSGVAETKTHSSTRSERKSATNADGWKGTNVTGFKAQPEVITYRDAEIQGSFEFDIICPNGDRLRIYVRPRGESNRLEDEISATFMPTPTPVSYTHPFVIQTGSQTLTSTPLLTPRGMVVPPASPNLVGHTIRVVHYIPNRQEEERQRLLQEEAERRARIEAEDAEREARVRAEEDRLQQLRLEEEERLRRLKEEEDRARREREADRERREREEIEWKRRIREEEEERDRRRREEDEERERKRREEEDRRRREDEDDEFRRNRIRAEEEERLERVRLEEELVRRRLIEESEKLERIRQEEEDRLRKAREAEEARARRAKEDENERERRRIVEEERLRRIQEEEIRLAKAKAEEEDRLTRVRKEEERLRELKDHEERDRRRRHEEDKQRRVREATEEKIRRQKAEEDDRNRKQKQIEEEIERRRRIKEEDDERRRKEKELEGEMLRKLAVEEARLRRLREEEEESMRRITEEERERLRRLQEDEEERLRRMIEEEEFDRKRRAEEERLRRAKEAEEDRLRLIHEEQARLEREREAEENRLRLIALEQDRLREAELKEGAKLSKIEDEVQVFRQSALELSKEKEKRLTDDERRRRERDDTEKRRQQERDSEKKKRESQRREEVQISRYSVGGDRDRETRVIESKTTVISRRYEEHIDSGIIDRDDDKRRHLDDQRRRQEADMEATQRKIRELKENLDRKKGQDSASRIQGHESTRYPNEVSYTSDRKGERSHYSPIAGGTGGDHYKYSANRDTAYTGMVQTRSKGNVAVHIHSSHVQSYEQPAMIEVNMENSNEDIDFRGYGTIQIRSRTNSPEGTRHQTVNYGDNEFRDQINRVSIADGGERVNQASQRSGVRVGGNDSRAAQTYSFGEGARDAGRDNRERSQGPRTSDHTQHITTSHVVHSKDYRISGSGKESRQSNN